MQIKIDTFIFISNIQKVGEALPLNEKENNCGLEHHIYQYLVSFCTFLLSIKSRTTHVVSGSIL